MLIASATTRGAMLAALTTFAVTGCSGDSGTSSSGPTSSPTASASAAFQVDPGATPAASGSAASGSSTPEPSATETPANGETAAASEIPTDEQARAEAEEFLENLQDKDFTAAWLEMCDAGREKFSNGAALQAELGLKDKDVRSYTLGGITDDVFMGDPRKRVASDLTYSNGTSEAVDLSFTLENGEAAVCGF